MILVLQMEVKIFSLQKELQFTSTRQCRGSQHTIRRFQCEKGKSFWNVGNTDFIFIRILLWGGTA